MHLARILRFIGRTLIWLGTITLLFVVYQLWGTGIHEARAQSDLASQFERSLAVTPPTAPSTTSTATASEPATSTSTTAAPVVPPDDGEAVAHLVIPKIGVDKIVVEGVRRDDLKKGPGHYTGTPLPGQPGNSAIAGHRTTYGAPFGRIDELVPGDEILVTTFQGSFRYEVTGQQIVRPSDVSVVDDQGDDRLTLTSCHPEYSARERIIVTARLAGEPATPPPTVPDRLGEPADEPADQAEVLEGVDAGESRSATPAVQWASVALAVWLAFYVLSRRWRRWPAYVLGAPVFLGAVYVFFESFSRLLPPNF